MAAQQRFFEIIHPGTDIDLIGKQKYWIGGSIFLVLLSLVMLPLNAYVFKGRGHALNWGVDFRGGTEILVEFSKPVEAGEVREAVAKGGYHNAEGLKYYQTPNAYMIRMGAVSIVSSEQAAQAQAALAKVGDANLNSQRGFDFTEGGDKIYLRFDKPVESQVLADALKQNGIPTTQVKPFGRADDHVYEATLVGLDIEVT